MKPTVEEISKGQWWRDEEMRRWYDREVQKIKKECRKKFRKMYKKRG